MQVLWVYIIKCWGFLEGRYVRDVLDVHYALQVVGHDLLFIHMLVQCFVLNLLPLLFGINLAYLIHYELRIASMDTSIGSLLSSPAGWPLPFELDAESAAKPSSNWPSSTASAS